MDSFDLKKTQMSDLVDASLNGKPTSAAITTSSSSSSINDQLVWGCARKRMVIVDISAKGGDLMLDSEKSTTISSVTVEESGREKLKRHRREMTGRVWIPETWRQEGFLEDWKECNVIGRSLFLIELLVARNALVEECRKANSGGVRIGNSC